jgi:hypothetical protein
MAGFTAIAAGVGLAVTAGTTIGSFAQAGEQARLKREAEEAAAKAMEEARKKLDVNYYEQLGIQKEPYELARRELLAQGALATQALAEGDERSLAAGVGRVQLAQQAGQEKVATAMQQEQAQLDKLVAGEDTRLRDIGVQLDTMEAQGAQQAASDAARAEAQAIQQGFAGLTSLGTQAASLAPLFAKTPEARLAAKIQRKQAGQPTQLGPVGMDLSEKPFREALMDVDPARLNMTNEQLSLYNQYGGDFSKMSQKQIDDFLGSLETNQLQNIQATLGQKSKGMNIYLDPNDPTSSLRYDLKYKDFSKIDPAEAYQSLMGMDYRTPIPPLELQTTFYPGQGSFTPFQFRGEQYGPQPGFYNPLDPFNINRR